MKLLKSSLFKKIIIILIAIMIFNIAVPKQVSAWDFAGILYKPLYQLILSILVTIDTTLGLTLNGLSSAVNVTAGFIETIVTKGESRHGYLR